VFDTLAQIGFAVALILPGFLVVQLSERQRPATPAGGDLELVLRGLVYALIIQAIAVLFGWLPQLVEDLKGPNWEEHLDALALYGLVACVATPTALGLLLGRLLRDAESKGALEWWHYALGGRDTRRAWDYAFSHSDGAWIRVFFLAPAEGQPPALIGKYGTGSWAAQTPAEPDLYLQEAWPADADGRAEAAIFNQPGVGAWIDGERIARIEIL
jgi:Family of unknown function (DUF6338)